MHSDPEFSRSEIEQFELKSILESDMASTGNFCPSQEEQSVTGAFKAIIARLTDYFTN